MLEYYFELPRTLAAFRQGPLKDHFDGLATHLKNNGYRYDSVQKVLTCCCRFNDFLIERDVLGCHQITPPLAISFLSEDSRKFHCNDLSTIRWHRAALLKHLIGYLTGIGVLQPFIEKSSPAPYDWILDPYMKYLREERQLEKFAVRYTERRLRAFLESLDRKVTPRQMKALGAEEVESFFKAHLQDGRAELQELRSALRGFLRFCVQEGHIQRDLSGIIPAVPSFRLASLPRGMKESDIQKILAAVPRYTPKGARDYAILLLLTAYGIRARQVAALTLDDICWPRSTIHIPAAKGGKEVIAPLLEAVGKAIAAFFVYRPNRPSRQLFLSLKPPYHPIGDSVVTQTVLDATRKARVKVPRGGASAFRHSWAIRALTHESSMKAIADMLGHRSINTSFIYAKADLKSLRQVAMPWPGVTS